jgi:hypothetical protein
MGPPAFASHIRYNPPRRGEVQGAFPESAAYEMSKRIAAILIAVTIVGAGRVHTQSPLGAESVALRTQAALMALDRYLETWNSRDPRLWATSLNFPHVRPGAGAFRLSHNTEEYVAGIDFEQTASTGWDHTEWVSRDVVQVGVDKIHAAATWQRYTKEGRPLATSAITYVITNQNDRWGVQARFAAGAGGVAADQAARNEAAARAALDAFVQAWNSHDIGTLARAVHYPQVRIADRQVEIWNGVDEFLAGTEAGRQRTWFQLRVDSVRAVQVAATGVNLVLSVSRLARDGRVMSKDDGLFLATPRDGVWKIQARSTFGT